MSQLTPKKSRAPGGAAVMPKNLVTEIVDQITEKQARAIRHAEAGPPVAREKASRSAETIAGTPYQIVLSCATEEEETS